MTGVEHETARARMVERQIARRGILDPRVLRAFENVPRHEFVPEPHHASAYDDCPLPIGYGQTISQPYIVALMTEGLRLVGSEKVLEIGTGSGYQAAILAELAAEVHTVEYLPELAREARERLVTYPHVHCHLGDGSLGWPESAPYDGILVAAAAPQAPSPLLDQLVDGGRLVIPVGGRGFQSLQVWRRLGERYAHEALVNVAFVPLRGECGWDRKEF